MGDSVFNIFGTTLTERTPQRTNITNFNNNANIGKIGLISKGLTPAKININGSTPRPVDPKKRTFLQNEGASIQTFRPTSYNNKKTTQSAAKANLQVYEDVITKEIDSPNMIEVEYTKKSMFYDDASDDEFAFTTEQIDNMVFGLPKHTKINLAKFETPKMELPTETEMPDDICDDIYVDPEPPMDFDELIL